MARKKSKYEILDRIFIKQGLQEYGYWWDDDDWDYHGTYCDCYACVPIDYEYLPDEFQPKPITYISKRRIRTEHTYSLGKLIDMSSIYSKEVLRQKRIDHILGIELMENYRPTLADILNIKK